MSTRAKAIYQPKLAALAPILLSAGVLHSAEPSIPPSPVIAGLSLDWSTHQRHAIGSDNWLLAWADDDHQYGAWGDGGGFGEGESGRVGLGYVRVEGNWTEYKGYNVWGGKDPENPAQFSGKSWGTICADGVLYSWVVPDVPDTGGPRDHYRYIELAKSTYHGAHWTKASWRWWREDNLIIPTFLVQGKNQELAQDGLIYSYFIRPQNTNVTQAASGLSVHQPGALFLARAPKTRLFEGREVYEWFTGFKDGKPIWGGLAGKTPVFEDPEGTGWCVSALYNPGLKRYLLATEHSLSHSGCMALFDAPQPWGPWTVVRRWAQNDPFGKDRPGSTLDWANNVFFFSFAPKWFSNDGLHFTLVFTGGGNGKNNDSFNTLSGTFQLGTSQTQPPAATTNGRLSLDSRSPVILDNDAFSDDWTLEYALARASQGQLDLRGIIGCKAGRDGHTIYLTAEQTCAEASHLIELARGAGLKMNLWPTLGANRGLFRPRSGRIEDTDPVHSPGSDLIVAEAHKATPEKPLVVMVGGHLTDLASAYLADSSISNRVMPFYIGGQADKVRDYNTWCDYWAFWIVASKFPMVCLPIESLFSSARPQMPFDRFGELPDNALGRYLREKRPRLEKLYPGGENDLGMATYFLHPELVRNTRRVCLDGWAKDDKGEEVPVVRNAAGGNLLFIIEADGVAGGSEWLSALTQSADSNSTGRRIPKP